MHTYVSEMWPMSDVQNRPSYQDLQKAIRMMKATIVQKVASRLGPKLAERTMGHLMIEFSIRGNTTAAEIRPRSPWSWFGRLFRQS